MKGFWRLFTIRNVLVQGGTAPETVLGFGRVGIGLKMVYRTSWLDKATNFAGKATTLYPFWSQNCIVPRKRYRKVVYHHPNEYLNRKSPNKYLSPLVGSHPFLSPIAVCYTSHLAAGKCSRAARRPVPP